MKREAGKMQSRVKKFSFPICSLSNSELVLNVLAEWVLDTLNRLCGGGREFVFVCSQNDRDLKWQVKSCRDLVHRVCEYEVVCGGDRLLVVVLSDSGSCSEFFVKGKKALELEFDEVVSQVEDVLNVIREAVEVEEEQSEHIRKILSEDARFADAYKRVFERRLEEVQK
jgi:hypothetical protein